MTLPSFSSRGKRLAGKKWTDNNLNKEVFKERVVIMELEKRTMGSVDTSRTA